MAACNTNTTNCSIEDTFAAANTACGQFFNPSNFQAEQLVYDAAFRDLINNFGVPVNYYIDTFNLSAADLLYGEHPTRQFLGPHEMLMYIELNENALNLSKYGFNSDDELTGYLHIDTFSTAFSGLVDYSSFNQSIEPKSGDLIEVTALGCDRPNGRGPKWFEVTERVDQDIASINPLLGHYVYRLRAKRYEYSFELSTTGELFGERANKQIYENSFSGILSSNIPGIDVSYDDVTTELEAPIIGEDGDPIDQENVTTDKAYTFDIDVESQTRVLDMDVNDTDIYGQYY